VDGGGNSREPTHQPADRRSLKHPQSQPLELDVCRSPLRRLFFDNCHCVPSPADASTVLGQTLYPVPRLRIECAVTIGASITLDVGVTSNIER
jgi:hypothetical protein